ncbi:MAG TPA: DUF885 domain-containing protein [Steroidobacteraceae bacterium]|nr:DUF885 domain-containing protein [Steroidobacteraceae bacterium]
MRIVAIVVLCAAAMAAASGSPRAQASVHDSLETLGKDLVYTTAQLYPMQATALGIAGHDAELEAPSEQARAAYVSRLRQWQRQLHSISSSFTPNTSLVDRDDARLLEAQLVGQLNALLVYRVDRKDYSQAANNVVGAIFTQFQNIPVAGQDGATAADVARAWDDIISRLGKAPGYIVAAQRLATTPGHLYGIVGAKELAGVADFFNGALTQAARTQIGSDAATWSRFLQARDATLAVIAATRQYIDAHVGNWPENYAMGRKAYDRLLREEKLLPFNADDLERMGQDELAHGWAEEAWLSSLAKRNATPFGAASGGGMAPGGPALIDYYRDRIAELRKFVVDNDVVTIPAWLGRMEVTQTPSFLQPVSPGASMRPPRLFATSTTGYYFITPPVSLADAAARLDMNEDFDHDRIMSTAAHEAMPGHFLQLSIAKRHPDFIRKIQDSTEFAEGWAYYGEEMFVRLGLYGANLDGRLFTARWERVRGARAIVDPKMATGEWTFQQGVDFFVSQAGFTREDAEAAVSSIATSPGYVIAYTAGRLQLENLLADYLQRTGDHGSLRDFHDRLLSYGTTPFAVVAPELLADLGKPASEVRAAAHY